MISTSVDKAVDAIRRAAPLATEWATPSPIAPTSRARPLTQDRYGQLAELLRVMTSGEATSLDLTMRAVDRARAWPGIVVDLDQAGPRALEAAAEADRRRSLGQTIGTLAGVPVTVKDNVDVRGLVSGQGGWLGRHESTTDSACWSRLHDEGSILIGHTSMHELAWGLTTPRCPNPWGTGLSTGGSSGGAAASVAAGIVPISIGTDTGGSIRVPAALCGVAGLRPTHGIPSLRGVASLAPSLDTLGTMALSAGDCVFVHELLSKPGTAAPSELNGVRVGVLSGWQGRVSAPVAAAMEASCAVLREQGVQICEVELSLAHVAPSVAYVIMLIESSRRWLAEAEHQSVNVGADVLEQLREGQRIDTSDGCYEIAVALARSLRVETMEAFRSQGLSALLSPMTASSGFRDDAATVAVAIDKQVSTTDALSCFSALASVTGLPALSLPAGLDDGVPVAVQLIGRPFDERMIATLARPIEEGPGHIVEMSRRKLGPSTPAA